jgi:hypothetical protein
VINPFNWLGNAAWSVLAWPFEQLNKSWREIARERKHSVDELREEMQGIKRRLHRCERRHRERDLRETGIENELRTLRKVSDLVIEQGKYQHTVKHDIVNAISPMNLMMIAICKHVGIDVPEMKQVVGQRTH